MGRGEKFMNMEVKEFGVLALAVFLLGASFLASAESIKVEPSDVEIVKYNEDSRIIPDYFYNPGENSDKYYLEIKEEKRGRH